MTSQKHLKARIRARMQKTGEKYVVARRVVLEQAPQAVTAGPDRFHLPGNVPATTALRVLLTATVPPGTEPPAWMSEAMLFGIAGGVGAGVFAFRYEKEDFSSFFVAGRHLWFDDLLYLENACARLGTLVQVLETGSLKTAEKQLRDALAINSPVIAWVDMAGLPRHASSYGCAGGQYHVVSVYGIDNTSGQVMIGDVADAPDVVALDMFAQARSRIKKQKNRLLYLKDGPASVDLPNAIASGIKACYDGLVGQGSVKPPGGKSMANNSTLEAFRSWGERLHGGNAKQCWSQMFPRGVNLWRGLTSIYAFVQYGTGGGLTRPLYADFFREAYNVVANPAMQELEERYRWLGAQWDELAEAALPDEVEIFRRFKELSVEQAELTLSQESDSASRLTAVVRDMVDLEQAAATEFPLHDAECDSLRADLQQRVIAIHRAEVAAREQLRTLV